MSETVDKLTTDRITADRLAADRLVADRRGSGATPPSGPPPPPPPGPIAQSVGIGFRVIYIAALLLTAAWLVSNVREIASDSQAVVRRFGRIVRAQESGLLVAWPRPIEEVQLLPGPQQELSQPVVAQPSPTATFAQIVGYTGAAESSARNAAPYLTGDGNVVLLDATLVYHIADPIAYALEQAHVVPALERLFRAATTQVAAGRSLNDFLVVQTSPGGANTNIGALRAEVRESLLRNMNARLQALAAAGTPLGVQVDRLDLTASLPPAARSAFNAVLVAAQTADRGVAQARTDAERRLQQGNQQHDELISAAQAQAMELVSDAHVNTADIVALEKEETPLTRHSLMLRAYRRKVASIISQIGSVTVVDPQSGARLILPGTQK